MLNSSLTAQSALQDQSASYRAALQVTSVPAGVSGVSLGDLISSGGSEGFSVAVNTTATGTQSTSYPIGVSDQQSLPGATGLTSQTFQVSGDVVDNRVVSLDLDRLRPGPRGGGPQPKRHPLHQRRRQPIYACDSAQRRHRQ